MNKRWYNVHILNIQNLVRVLVLEDLFQLLKAINKQPVTNQRDLANAVGLSVGKVNALLKEAEQQGT